MATSCESDIIIWEISSGKMVKRIKGSHYKRIDILALIPEKDKVMTNSRAGSIKTGI